MKKVLSVLVALFLFGSLNAQTPVFQEDFSGGIPSTWTMYNDNNTLYEGFADYYGWPDDVAWFAGSAQSFGAPCAVSLTYFTTTTAAADRWLITPSFNVTEEHTYLSFYAGAGNTSYPEKLLVKASTTNTEKESFTIELLNEQSLIGNYYYIDLSQFVGQSIHIAFIAKSVDGLLVMLAEVQAQVMPQHAAAIAAVSTPKYAPMGGNTNVSMTIKNMGYEPITSFDATYTVDGTTSAVMNVTGVNIPLNETYTFTHNAPYVCNEEGNKTFTVSVTNINGTEVSGTDPSNANSTTTFFNPAEYATRTNLLEEFSTTRCGNCPAAVERINQALEGRDDVIWIVHHAGYYTDAYTCSASEDLLFLYNDGGSTYAPAAMVNRTRVTTDPGPVFLPGSANEINTCIDAAASPAAASIAMTNVTYDATTRKVTGTVDVHYLNPANVTASPAITVYFVEDSIWGTQAGASGQYLHMHAVRDCLTPSMGQAITLDANGNASYAIDYTVPSNFNADHGRLVALVANSNRSNANDNQVVNAVKTKYLPNVGINMPGSIELSIFPNPATQVVNVLAEESINSVRVMNALGQVVYTNNNVNAESMQLNVNDYAAGMYIITVNTDKGTSTQRVMVR